jgi:hypothetical protein
MNSQHFRQKGQTGRKMPWWLSLIVISLVLWAIAFLALWVV